MTRGAKAKQLGRKTGRRDEDIHKGTAKPRPGEAKDGGMRALMESLEYDEGKATAVFEGRCAGRRSGRGSEGTGR